MYPAERPEPNLTDTRIAAGSWSQTPWSSAATIFAALSLGALCVLVVMLMTGLPETALAPTAAVAVAPLCAFAGLACASVGKRRGDSNLRVTNFAVVVCIYSVVPVLLLAVYWFLLYAVSD